MLLGTSAGIRWMSYQTCPTPAESGSRNIFTLCPGVRHITWSFVAALHPRLAFIDRVYEKRHSFTQGQVFNLLNAILERESSGYRFVAGQLAPITNSSEVAAIRDAIASAAQHGMRGAETHIAASVKLLGMKPKPDYRNAVKEAILAVESVAKQIAKREKATLDSALKALSAKSAAHPALQAGFSAIYGYTSDADGIRHGILDEPTWTSPKPSTWWCRAPRLSTT
jgi:hypothetical protein